jgi:hypothetical protein
MKKEKLEPKEKANAAAGNFVTAVQTGLTEMNKRLQDMEQKVQEKDKLLNDMAMALKSQQDVLVNTPPEVQGSEAERDQYMKKGELVQIIKEGIQLIRQQTGGVDPRVERAIAMQDRLVDAMWEKMARALISDKDAAPGVS